MTKKGHEKDQYKTRKNARRKEGSRGNKESKQKDNGGGKEKD